MDIKHQSRKKLGLLIIGLGLALIFLSFILKWKEIPDILLGRYSGPLVIVIGGAVMISHKDEKK